jgi:hypothetical protein
MRYNAFHLTTDMDHAKKTLKEKNILSVVVPSKEAGYASDGAKHIFFLIWKL